MSQYKAIPQPTDQRNVSQNDILTNFNYLSTPLNPGGGVAPGILPVDHYASGDNVANPTDGFHKQVSFLNRTTPANLTNAINGKNSNNILYAKVDGAGKSQARLFNNMFDAPVTYLYAAVNFVPSTGVINGNAFNVSGVVRNQVGSYTISFATTLPSALYQTFMTMETDNTPPAAATPRISQVYSKLTTSVSISCQNPLGVYQDAQLINVMVIGFF